MKLFLSFFIVVTLVHATIVIDNNSKEINKFELSYYNDPTASLTLNDISRLDFNRTLPNAFALNHTQGIDWFKMTIVNDSDDEDFLLHVNDVWIYQMNLYSFEEGKIKKTKGGLSIPISEKKIKNTHPTLAFHVDKGQSKTFFIEIEALLGTTAKFIIYSDKNLYLESQLLTVGLYMFYLGAALVIVMFNFFLFLTLKEKIYLYYSMYVLTLTIFTLSLEGIVEYILPQSYYAILFLSPLAITFLLLFSREILKTPKYLPRVDKFFIALILVLLILTLLIYINPLSWWMLYNNILAPVLFFIFFTAIFLWKKSDSDAKFYLLFMTVYIVSLIIFALMTLGVIEYNDFTRYSYIYASFFEMTLFSLVLANRFHQTKKAKKVIESDLKNTKELSQRDALTTLHNRHYLKSFSENYFAKAKREKEDVSIIMLDVDHFKQVNDTYGHAVGDLVLQKIAIVFKNLTRQSDLLIRYGGEEFVIILKNTNLENAKIIAEKIRLNIENLKIKYEEDKELSVSISLGISLLKVEDESLRAVINKADKALYESKTSGRNKVSVLL